MEGLAATAILRAERGFGMCAVDAVETRQEATNACRVAPVGTVVYAEQVGLFHKPDPKAARRSQARTAVPHHKVPVTLRQPGAVTVLPKTQPPTRPTSGQSKTPALVPTTALIAIVPRSTAHFRVGCKTTHPCHRSKQAAGYVPGLRRLRRAPTAAFGAPSPANLSGGGAPLQAGGSLAPTQATGPGTSSRSCRPVPIPL